MKRLLLFLIILSGFLTTKLQASLGDSESTVDSDSQKLKSTHNKSHGQGYTVHELSTSTTIVREYVAASGTVFAVTWRGMARPDLSLLLGSYYAEYEQVDTQSTKRHGRQETLVKTSKIVVSRGGHMRDIHGKAYVPDLVPTGVDVGSLQ